MSRIMDCGTDENREHAITAVVDAAKAGRLVVMPADTVYGLGCDAFDNQAVAFLLCAKHHGPDIPISALVGSWNTIKRLVREYSPAACTLVKTFWPGGLSLVVNQTSSLPWNLGDTVGTVVLRMPLYPIAVKILRRTGPITVPSANISDRTPATNAVRAKQILGGETVVYVDGGEATTGTPSTIVGISTPVPQILHEGVVSAVAVAEILNTTPERLLRQ